jgi:prolyl-tRNA synthetase
MEQDLAIPVWRGRKTDREKFAGAVVSWSCEGLMGDGKALQTGTSHELGQNFADAFDITYTDEHGERQRPWQTSWGASTRLLGAMIMVHGDDDGLRLPPRVAPTQVVVLVARAGEGVVERATRLVEDLRREGVRVELDAHTDISVGRRIVDWELRGVPVRVELGPRDLESGQVPLALRARGEKRPHALEGLARAMPAILETEHGELLRQATELRDRLTRPARTVEEAAELTRDGAARLPWTGVGEEGERRLLADGVSVRCLVREDRRTVDDPDADGVEAIVARAY